MATYMYLQRRRRRAIRRNRVFRDRTHPLDVFSDTKVFKKFRFHRQAILDLVDSVSDDLEYVLPRKGSLPPVLQVLLTLRYYATGAFQDVIADLIGVSQPTVCRTVLRVTDAFHRQIGQWVRMPTPREAQRNKQKFFAMQRFPKSSTMCLSASSGVLPRISRHRNSSKCPSSIEFWTPHIDLKRLFAFFQ